MAEQSFFDKVSTHASHVPDVLSCIANLSNDEVFTPPEVVNKMLDLLPQELFANPDTTFLDPATKTGVFLREIAKRCLAAQLPGYAERSAEIAEKKALEIPLDEYDLAFQKQLQEKIDHIFHKQLFGIGITELTSLLSRRSVYCSKYPNGPYSITHFDDAEGNIRFRRTEHIWKDGKCVWCGASKEQYDRDKELESHAYEFIHIKNPEDIFKMKFDVIISNPPYQLNDGGGTGSSAMPIYQHFVRQAEKLQPNYIAMIIPSRWFAGGKGLDDFRSHMLNSNNISTLVDFANSADCFPGVIIAGGVNYFLWEKGHNGLAEIVNMKGNDVISKTTRSLNEFDVFVRDNTAIEIIRKIKNKATSFIDSIVYSRNCFDLFSKETGHTQFHQGDLTLYSLSGKSYISQNKIQDKNGLLDKYKVIMTKAMSGGNKPSSDGKYQVISATMRVLAPNEVCTETYLCLGSFSDVSLANNLSEYLKTKFFRFLLLQALTSINISKEKFQFIPVVDFSKMWSDDELYSYFELEQSEIDFIENLIKPMGGED